MNNGKPLVSILIPAFNKPNYFEEALNSALSQSYDNVEILIGDDSTNFHIKRLMEKYLKFNDNISYSYNNKKVDDFGNNNIRSLFKKAKGEYINYLCHDDLFHKDKIKIMLDYYKKYKNISIVTSYRKVIDEYGNVMNCNNITGKLYNESTVVSGKVLGKNLLKTFVNFIGEPTTVLFKKATVDDFGVYEGRKYYCLVDIAQWLQLLRQGDAVYIPEALSCFRVHKEQNQKKPNLMKYSIIDSFHMIIDSYKASYFIENEQEFLGILDYWISNYGDYINYIYCNMNKLDYINKDEEFKVEFMKLWKNLKELKLI